MGMGIGEGIAVGSLAVAALGLILRFCPKHLSMDQCNERHKSLDVNIGDIKADVKTIKEDIKGLTYKVMEVLQQ